jgi:hypothetical protein
MSTYDVVIDTANHPSYNLSNFSSCVPHREVIEFSQMVIFKSDAYRLAIICFVAGLCVSTLFDYIDKRWKRK